MMNPFTMNERYTQTEIIRGREYRYDADQDTWYPVTAPENPISTWSWVICCVLLAVVAYLIER